MKPQFNRFSLPTLITAAAIAFCVGTAPNAHAGTYYWDPNGAGTADFGTATGTWGTSAFWGTDSAGSGTTANTPITITDDVNFGTTSAGLLAGTITGPSTAQGFLNMTFGSASGAVNLSGGKLNLSTAGSTITVNNAADSITNTILQGAGGKLIKAGTGKLTLNVNTANKPTYTGATVVDEGTLELIAVNTTATGLASSSSITINDGGTILVSGDNSFQGYSSTSAGKLTIHTGGSMTTSSGVTAWIRGALELNGGSLASHATTDSQYGTWTLGQDVTAINAVTSTMSAKEMNWTQATTRTFTVSDAAGILNVTGTFARPAGFASGAFTGALTKSGVGTMVLSGANTYTGTTTVTEGKLSFGTGGSARNSSEFTVASGATLELNGTNVFVANHSTAMDNSRVITVNGGTLLMTGTSEVRIGNVTLNDGATWTSNRGVASYDILLANTSTGAATVAVTGNAASLMNGSGGIHLNGVQNFDVANVTSSTAADLTVSMVLADQLKDTTVAGGISKSGAGTMVLSGNNTYTGTTNVTEGTLVINGNISNSSLTTVDSGATLSGNGTAGKTVIHGTLSVGNSPGTMTFSDTLGLNGNTIMEIDGTAGAGVAGGNDFINLTGVGAQGALTYGGSLTLDIGTLFSNGIYTWNLFDMASTTGTFSTISLANSYSGSLLDTGLTGVWNLADGDHTWQFSESTGVLGLTVIPEPGTALLGGLGLLALLRRRR